MNDAMIVQAMNYLDNGKTEKAAIVTERLKRRKTRRLRGTILTVTSTSRPENIRRQRRISKKRSSAKRTIKI